MMDTEQGYLPQNDRAVPKIHLDSFRVCMQALRNIWYGQPNPILRAKHWTEDKGYTGATEEEIVNALAFFAEQLDAALGRLPESVRAGRRKLAKELPSTLSAFQEELEQTEEQIRGIKRRLGGIKSQKVKLLAQQKQELAEIACLETKGLRITIEAVPGYEQDLSEEYKQGLHQTLNEVIGGHISCPTT